MKENLRLRDLEAGAEWLPVRESFRQYSEVDHFESYFDRPSSIHGVRHARRVLLHTLLLCQLCRLPEPDRQLLVGAALFHDIGRENDGLCFRHGRRSAAKMAALQLAPTEPAAFAIQQFIVTYHCIDDRQAAADLPGLPAVPPERAWRLFCVLKDADGLDRVRIGDLDASYLRNPEAGSLTELAWELLESV